MSQIESYLKYLPEQNVRFIIGVLNLLQVIKAYSSELPLIGRGMVVGKIKTKTKNQIYKRFFSSKKAASLILPLQAFVSSLFQLIALDKVGSPSIRSYKLMLAGLTAYALGFSPKLQITKNDFSKFNSKLAAHIVAYYSVQTAIGAFVCFLFVSKTFSNVKVYVPSLDG